MAGAGRVVAVDGFEGGTVDAVVLEVVVEVELKVEVEPTTDVVEDEVLGAGTIDVGVSTMEVPGDPVLVVLPAPVVDVLVADAGPESGVVPGRAQAVASTMVASNTTIIIATAVALVTRLHVLIAASPRRFSTRRLL